ncbi:MAG: hypothetical protein K940chlam3_01321 [Chlamydiae bacterium]|nr:hypothetical protein [Chlamydiota bacterium]
MNVEQVTNQSVDEYSKYTSKTLPNASKLNLFQSAWLKIYWQKLGEEQGKPLTNSQKAWNIPEKSDSWGWDAETWSSWCR